MKPEFLEFWIDLNLPPILAMWLKDEFKVSAKSFAELNLATVSDAEIFKLAKTKSNTIIITTKDYDFVSLIDELNSPPRILYLNTGNISNKELKNLIFKSFNEVIRIFSKTNQTVVELIK